jgi:hypothetical protein
MRGILFMAGAVVACCVVVLVVALLLNQSDSPMPDGYESLDATLRPDAKGN